MKANELMIGDRVNLSKGNWSENRQVELIDIEMVAEGVYLAEPIPLTPEILEKNGFEIYEQDFTSNIVYKFGSFDYIEYVEYPKYFNIGNKITYKHFTRVITYIHPLMRIRYVHELQHALRLCQINKEITL